MNNHELCYRRDNQILEALQTWKVMDTWILSKLYFPSLRMAQRRLQRLTEKRRINKFRPSIDSANLYYIGKRPVQIEHKLTTNWIRMYLLKQLKSWESFSAFEYEIDFDYIRPDGLFISKNNVTNKLKCWFVEADLANDPFDKVPKYCKLYKSQGIKKTWWAKYIDHFPHILVATVTTERQKAILKTIERYNSENLSFEVRLISEIKSEVMQNEKNIAHSTFNSIGGSC